MWKKLYHSFVFVLFFWIIEMACLFHEKKKLCCCMSIHDFLWLFSTAHLVELAIQCWLAITIAKSISIISIHSPCWNSSQQHQHTNFNNLRPIHKNQKPDNCYVALCLLGGRSSLWFTSCWTGPKELSESLDGCQESSESLDGYQDCIQF